MEGVNSLNNLGDSEKNINDYYKLIVDNGHDLILIISIQKNPQILFFSPSFIKVLGYNLDIIKDRFFHQVVHPEDKNKLLEGMNNIIIKGKFFSKEALRSPKNIIIRLRDSLGKWKYFDIAANRTNDKIIVVGRDVSDRIEIKESLEHSEEKYRGIIEATNTGFLITDEKGNVIDANKEYVRISGHKDFKEIKGRNIIEWTANHDLQKNIDAFTNCLNYGHIYGLEIDYISKSNEVIPIEINASVITDQNKKRVIALCRDISEKNKNRKKIQESERKIKKEKELAEKYLDIAGVIIVAIGVDQKVTLINKTGCKILGYTQKEIIGKNWFDSFVVDEKKQEVKAFFNKMIKDRTKLVEYFENTILTKSKQERLIAWHNTIIEDEDGKVVGTLSSGEDVTEKKKNEDEIKIRNYELERFNKLSVGRELKMIELKEKIKELENYINSHKYEEGLKNKV